MTFDATKLSPAPWSVDDLGEHDDGRPWVEVDEAGGGLVLSVNGFAPCDEYPGCGGDPRANAAFVALARNAFDVLMRRGWSVQKDDDGWTVYEGVGDGCFRLLDPNGSHADPFTALVSADEWYRANVEKEGPSR